MKKSLADLLVERLIAWGVDTIFGLPGDGINGIMEALRTRQDSIQFIQVRHEESAAFAACGYAKYTGRLGVCLATSGPGGIHLLNGLYDAKCDGQPVLAITGHTFHDLIGTGYQQDIDLNRVFADVAAYNERVTGPEHVVNVVDQAVRVALGQRTVAHLTIPKDIQEWTTSTDERSEANIAEHSSPNINDVESAPTSDQVNRAVDLINEGTKIAILAGRGALAAREELLALAEKLGAPIVKALLGKAAVPDDSPYTTGGLGLLGTSPSYDVMKACDTLIIVGSNFPYLEFYPEPGQARVVQIDYDPAHIGLRCPVEVGLVGDCHRVLNSILARVHGKEKQDFLHQSQAAMRNWRELLEERGNRPEIPMKPQVIAHHVNRFLDDDAIIATDCGTVTSWAARYIQIREDMLFSSSGLLASMANALPYSIGAAVAFPDRQVVCLTGDGGLSMLMPELATLAKYQLPVKVIVFKNNSLGQIKWEQMAMEGNPEFGCDLQPIDFAGVARACGIASFSVDDPAQVYDILEIAFAVRGPALVEATVDQLEPVIPGHVTMSQAWNFASSLIRGEKDGWKLLKTAVADHVREIF